MDDKTKELKIKEKREKIDELDKSIIDLLEKRVATAEEIINLKKDLGKSKHSPNREQNIKSNLNDYSKLPKSFVFNVYESILNSVKDIVK